MIKEMTLRRSEFCLMIVTRRRYPAGRPLNVVVIRPLTTVLI